MAPTLRSRATSSTQITTQASVPTTQSITQASGTTTKQIFSVEQQVEVTGPKGPGILRVSVEVFLAGGYKACQKMDVTISHKVGKSKRFFEVGFMVGIVVDKQLKVEVDNKNSKDALWMQELLEQDDTSDQDYTHGLREAAKLILNDKSGSVKATFKGIQPSFNAARPHFKGDSLVFIDTFMLNEAHRVRGAGVQPMRMLLGLLPTVLGREDGSTEATTPCFLSPARLWEVDSKNGKTDREIEAALMRTYAKNGFNVWLLGDPNIEESASVMGRLV